jgi:lipoprotein-anchoring transpeptidase ErfK/SrfK
MFFLGHASQYVMVDLSEQRAYAIENGSIIFDGRISSGKRGRETPEGEYTILQKKRHHRSNLWPKPKGGAKMPYMLRLTNSGIAMHLGNVPNRPASHGCIRLENGFAQKMFAWANVGITVYVEGYAFDENDNYFADDYVIITP